MGCVGSKTNDDDDGNVGGGGRANGGAAGGKARDGPRKKLKRPKPWKSPEPLTPAQLHRMRDEFWDTAPAYGGQKEIWDALRAAAEADLQLAQVIVDSAGIIVAYDDLSTCYDERGAKYDLPNYVLSEPTNMVSEPEQS
eukprot:SM000007S20938  [mRNA]  locus=s7:1087399:1088728:- [translate_table: standard]